MNNLLQFLGVLFILLAMLLPLIYGGAWYRGHAAGIRWANRQIYGSANAPDRRETFRRSATRDELHMGGLFHRNGWPVSK